MIRIFPLLLILSVGLAYADEPVIEHVEAKRSGMGWRINVTLSHPDSGWDHYADGWEVLDGDGKRLGFRELMHPHVHEQPFTRSLFDVMIPDGATEIFLRARCSEEGWSESLTRVPLRK